MPPYVLTLVRLDEIEQNDEYLRAADKTGADAEAILAHIRQVQQLPPLGCSMSAAGDGAGGLLHGRKLGHTRIRDSRVCRVYPD